MDDVTHLLEAVERGEPEAADRLLPVIYDELRRLARQKMSGEPENHTLQATALVHEAWIRLSKSTGQRWDHRGHFFAAAGEAMRRILVDHARRRLAQKRGGGTVAEPVEDALEELVSPPDQLIAINDALQELEKEDADAARLVTLRYFVGLTMEEAAAALGMSKRSAEALWTYARVRLRREMDRGN